MTEDPIDEPADLQHALALVQDVEAFLQLQERRQQDAHAETR